MLFNPGCLKKKIKIVAKEISKDVDGFPIVKDVLKLVTRAKVINESGTELKKANSDFSRVTTRFFMRTPSKFSIDHNWQIEFKNKRYNIIYVNDYGYDGVCTEILAELVKK